MSRLRKPVDVTREDGKTSSDIPAFPRKVQPMLIEGQALAELVRLPRICCNRTCRRTKLCLGPDLRCLTDHAGIGVRRWRGMDAHQREADLRRRVEEKAAGELNIDLGRSTVPRVEASPVGLSRGGER